MPMPDAAPVTIARLPERSIPSATSAAVECRPNGVAIALPIPDVPPVTSATFPDNVVIVNLLLV
jgi:hypothetical protein